jgi:alditol oxidase
MPQRPETMRMTARLSNWAGNVTFGAKRLWRPSSIPELQQLVATSTHIRALGTAHSFSPIADSPGDLVSLAGLQRIMDIDSAQARVKIDAGVRYAELAVHLNRAGFALHNLASLPHISVAGACATGSHGSGDANGGLATAVSAVEMVTADGEIVTVSRDDGDEFRGAVAGLGALGIVVGLTLDIVPAFALRQIVYDNMPREQVERKFGEVTSRAYSVSLFTDWRGSRFNQVWLKQRAGENDPDPEPEWLGAQLARAPRHPVPGMPVTFATQQLGVPGPWHERLPHFRPSFTPSAGSELQSEFLVPRAHATEAMAAIVAIGDRVAPVLQISEIRTIAADELWLSPSYHRAAVGFHFTWVDDAKAVIPVIAAVEERLAEFQPRPHWGKLFVTNPRELRSRYERLPDFQRLMHRYDAAGKFRNEFIDRYIASR